MQSPQASSEWSRTTFSQYKKRRPFFFSSQVYIPLLDTNAHRILNSRNMTNMAQQKTLTMLIRVHAGLREDKKPGGTKAEEKRAREAERTWREGRAEKKEDCTRGRAGGREGERTTVEGRGGWRGRGRRIGNKIDKPRWRRVLPQSTAARLSTAGSSSCVTFTRMYTQTSINGTQRRRNRNRSLPPEHVIFEFDHAYVTVGCLYVCTKS